MIVFFIRYSIGVIPTVSLNTRLECFVFSNPTLSLISENLKPRRLQQRLGFLDAYVFQVIDEAHSGEFFKRLAEIRSSRSET